MKKFRPILLLAAIFTTPISLSFAAVVQVPTGQYMTTSGGMYSSISSACETYTGTGYDFVGTIDNGDGSLMCRGKTKVPAGSTWEPYTINIGWVYQQFYNMCAAPSVIVNGICVTQSPPPPAVPPKSNGSTCKDGGAETSNPINIANGNKFLAELSFRGMGAFPLEFSLHYNSSSKSSSLPGSQLFSGIISGSVNRNTNLPLYSTGLPPVAARVAPGTGWNHNYHRSVSLQADLTTVNVLREDGKIYTFKNIQSIWKPDADIVGSLSEITSGGTRAGWRYINANDETETYDPAGRLNFVTTRTGLQHLLSYDDAGRVATVSDSYGRMLTLGYDASNRPNSMTDPAGNVFSYGYDANNNLATITYPDATVKTLLYENSTLPNAVTGIIDENGKRYITYHYDSTGRGDEEYLAGGVGRQKLTFATDGSSTTVIDPRGNASTLSFSMIQGASRLTGRNQPGGSGCSAASSAMTYDANGNVASRTDFTGVQTTYQYDMARNLETSRTEAAGTPVARTITTQWHASYRLPTQISEPGRVTTMSYDSSGNLLQRSVAANNLVRTWKYTYDNLGHLLTMTEPRTDADQTTTYSYDAQGNLETIRNAAGHLTRMTSYDANGLPLTIVDPNGTTTSLSYDARQRLISRTTGGETIFYHYDGVGQLTQVTQADGSATYFTFDDAHRLVATSDNAGNRIDYVLDAAGNRTSTQMRDPNGVLTRNITKVFDALNRPQQVTGAKL